MSKEVQVAGGIRTESVRSKTGKSWSEWFAILDRAGSTSKSHKEIAAWIADQYKTVGGWWSQMITVAYEQERGMRTKHERADGFTANVSKTIAAPSAALFAAWTLPRARKKWIDAPFTIRTAKEGKSVRFAWIGGSAVEVRFESKGEQKTQVAVEHSKLPRSADVTKMKAFWRTALTRLEEVV